MSHLRTTKPKARKRHRCDLCWGHIEPGATYDRGTYLGDSGLYEFLTCQGCIDDRLLTVINDWADVADEGVTFDDAREWANDAAGDLETERAQERWRARYEAGREVSP